MTTPDTPRVLRRYLLGAATDDEITSVERQYFDREESLQEVSDVEDDLIADFLEGRLAADERARFETHYLASPRHRTRVGIVRALRRAAGVHGRHSQPARIWQRVVAATQTWPVAGQLAAAVALIALGLAAWTFNGSHPAPTPTLQTEAPRPDTQPAQPPAADVPEPRRVVTVALAIAPINVRSGGEPARLVIPDDADVVVLELQDEAGAPRVERGKAIVRTVSGGEVWTGATTGGGTTRSDVIARLEIPASAFSPDDYIVELYAADATGRESERNRYFFRVRQR